MNCNLGGGISSKSGRPKPTTTGSDTRKMKHKKVPWTEVEDRELERLVSEHGAGKWTTIAESMVSRSNKQCSQRWKNHLDPSLQRSTGWNSEQEQILVDCHKQGGNCWTMIATNIEGKSENDVKNHWNSTMARVQSNKLMVLSNQPTYLENYIKEKIFNTGFIPASSSPPFSPNNGIGSTSSLPPPIPTLMENHNTRQIAPFITTPRAASSFPNIPPNPTFENNPATAFGSTSSIQPQFLPFVGNHYTRQIAPSNMGIYSPTGFGIVHVIQPPFQTPSCNSPIF